MGVLFFAETRKRRAPAIMQVHIDQSPPVASKLSTLELHLTDPQGVPIEQAQVIPSAWMTNMDMETKQMRVVPLGRGNYATEVQLFMAGAYGSFSLAHSCRFFVIKKTHPPPLHTPNNHPHPHLHTHPPSYHPPPSPPQDSS